MHFSNPIRPKVNILKNDKYGWRTLNGRRVWHNGADLRPVSDDILASHEGTVTFSGRDQFGALFIEITSGNPNGNQKTRYVHNRQNLVARGQQVKRGQLIGYIGSTGLSTARHLHFETWIDGVRVNPESVVDFNSQPYTEPPAPAPTPIVEAPAPQQFQYTVKRGDTLSEIVANHYGLSRWVDIKAKFTYIASINGITNPNLININQILNLPN